MGRWFTRLALCLAATTSLSLTSMAVSSLAVENDAPKALSFKMESLAGKPVDLQQYKGKVVLIVNVASQCGLTGQYKGLQKIYDKYKDQGLVILGFPCNQFGMQEPGSSQEISEFCKKNYGVTFDLFQKINVNDKDGDKACDLYRYLTSQDTQPKGKGKISWNFEKFVLNRKGEVVARFAPQTEPEDKALLGTIEKELAAR